MGIISEYVDLTGRRCRTDDDTRVALLAAMGIDASDEASAERALAAERERERRRTLEPVHVVRADVVGSWRLPLRPPVKGPLEYELELRTEDGRSRRIAGRLEPDGREPSRLPLPLDPGPGYHTLDLVIQASGQASRAETALIVSPGRCVSVEERLAGARAFGVWANLYATRSQRDWGVGDLGTLTALTEWAAANGAAFVGLNPLHAIRNRGDDISPYSPVSRLFRNELYLDLESIPELAETPEARRRIESAEHRRAVARTRAEDRVRYEAVQTLKRPLLESLHRSFAERHRGKGTARGRAYRDFLDRVGAALTDFATFRVLEEHLAENGHPRDWRRWPAPYRDPSSSKVRAFRDAHFEAVDFQRYLQFELDRQLATVAERAATAGSGIGLYGDLAIGSAVDGFDAWAFSSLFVEDAHIGAPPDDYSIEGQDWGLPPLDPRRLRDDRYRYWTLLLRTALRHSGALRLDHVMALFRLYWVPAGQPATRGAYVRYPADELLGILALESQRQDAVIVGEDLGTVPDELPGILARWGILSSQVLYFERDSRGRFRPPSSYSERALVTATTHDHPPLAGFWRGRDLELRRAVGELPDDEALTEARSERGHERRALLDALAAEGLWPEEETTPDWSPELCGAVHAFLARTPAPLLGLALDDLLGVEDPVNLPGVGLDRYPSWSRRPGTPIERLPELPTAQRALKAVADVRATPSDP